MAGIRENSKKIGAFGWGMWRYWRSGVPKPESNYVVQKLYAYTDGRSNDFLFRILESRRKERDLSLGWEGSSLVSDVGATDPTIEQAARFLREDGVVVLPRRLKSETIASLYGLALSCSLNTTMFGPVPANHIRGTHTAVPRSFVGTSNGFDPIQPRYSEYLVPREIFLDNPIVQSLLCDPYLLAIATRYLGVFPVVTKPEMWWDTDCYPPEFRPRPFHTDSGCLRWIKVGINLTDTTLETPHFVYVKGSHNPGRMTRSLTRRLTSRMNLSDKEVQDVCPDKIVAITAPAGSITLADTRGFHKGELAVRGHRLILYFGLDGSAFNNIDRPIPVNHVGAELERAMRARPFTYQFFCRATSLPH